MARSSQRNSYRRKRNNEKRLLENATNGAKDLINDLRDEGIDIKIKEIPRSGSKGNITVKDVRHYMTDFGEE